MDNDSNPPHPRPLPERMALEYDRLSQLIDAAADGKDLAQYSGDSVMYVDPATGRILDANIFALDLIGYSRDEIVRLTVAELETPEEASGAGTRTYIESSIEEQVYTALFRHRSGYRLPVQVNRRLVQRGEAKVLYYCFREQSLYQRTWQELRRREDNGFQFQQKLKALNELTIALSRIDSFDTLCYEAVRLGREQLGFDRMSIWFLDAERGVMTGSYGVDEEGNIRREADREWHYHDTYIMNFIGGKTEVTFSSDDAPIYNDKSEIIHYGGHISAPMLHGSRFIGILTSDNYLRQQPMKPYEPELLRQYGITVGHLTELSRAREQAFTMRLEQERMRVLQQLITNIGHDFKTPLATISVKTYFIERVQTAEQKQALTAGIQEQVAYITGMIDRMLEFIALESEVTLDLAPVDLGKLLAEVVDAYRVSMDMKQIQCEIGFENAATITGDAAYLRRAFMEIIDNAIRYTPASGRIQVNFARYPSQIGIRVRDNGIGIPGDSLDKVFVPLYRADTARTERRNGLGLTIAKRIVELHRGKIVMKSAPNEGSLFEIILPLA